MHPASRRCSSVKYSRYSPSSRLSRRAPRRPRCVTVFMKGSTKLTKPTNPILVVCVLGGLRELCGFPERVVVSATALVPPQTVLRGSLKELPRDVEAERPVVLVGAAAGDLSHSGA